jgi:hypothetical protein
VKQLYQASPALGDQKHQFDDKCQSYRHMFVGQRSARANAEIRLSPLNLREID